VEDFKVTNRKIVDYLDKNFSGVSFSIGDVIVIKMCDNIVFSYNDCRIEISRNRDLDDLYVEDDFVKELVYGLFTKGFTTNATVLIDYQINKGV